VRMQNLKRLQDTAAAQLQSAAAPQLRRMELLDSLACPGTKAPSVRPPRQRGVLHHLREFFIELFSQFVVTEHEQREADWQLAYYPGTTPSFQRGVPRQHDSAACGVCCCVNAWHLVRGLAPMYTCPFGMVAWRRWCLAVILFHGCTDLRIVTKDLLMERDEVMIMELIVVHGDPVSVVQPMAATRGSRAIVVVD
jgi:hypothetical protein